MPPAKQDPNFGETPQDTPAVTQAPEGYISRAELEEILATRDQQYNDQLAAVRSRVPVAVVPAHSGGPGNDNHQQSWSLVEQQLASSGVMLDHWIVTE